LPTSFSPSSRGATEFLPGTLPAAPCEFQCSARLELIQLSSVTFASIGCAPAVEAASMKAPVAAVAASAMRRDLTPSLLLMTSPAAFAAAAL
jgi:hypothetical protein